MVGRGYSFPTLVPDGCAAVGRGYLSRLLVGDIYPRPIFLRRFLRPCVVVGKVSSPDTYRDKHSDGQGYFPRPTSAWRCAHLSLTSDKPIRGRLSFLPGYNLNSGTSTGTPPFSRETSERSPGAVMFNASTTSIGGRVSSIMQRANSSIMIGVPPS